MIGTIEKEITKVDRQITDHIDNMLELKQKADILESVIGIGDVTASMLVTELPELGLCNKRQTASLVGVAPMNRGSGTLCGKRMTGGGRKQVRTDFFKPALVVIRYACPLQLVC